MTAEVWDQTGGILLQFIGRRSIGGMTVGTEIKASGMVADENGMLVIRNPKFELRIKGE